MTKKRFTIIVGKSASGKTTLANYMVQNGYRKYKTTTTRPMRENETNKDYTFISEKKFLNKLDKGEFIEYNTYNVIYDNKDQVWYYGTPILKNTRFNFSKYVIVLTLDGAMEFVKYYGKDKCKIIYLECSDDERELRARKRGSFQLSEWSRRLKADREDFGIDKVKLNCDMIIDTRKKSLEEILREVEND